jgi:hypothetical protein
VNEKPPALYHRGDDASAERERERLDGGIDPLTPHETRCAVPDVSDKTNTIVQ